MGFPKSSLAASDPLPHFENPQSIFDLLNFQLHEFLGISGSLVTRICENEYGITREEWQFVAMLAELGGMSPSDLAARTTVDRSQASKTLRGLMAKGLVDRQPVPGDGRKARVQLTEAGMQLYRQIFPAWFRCTTRSCKTWASTNVRPWRGPCIVCARAHWLWPKDTSPKGPPGADWVAAAPSGNQRPWPIKPAGLRGSGQRLFRPA